MDEFSIASLFTAEERLHLLNILDALGEVNTSDQFLAFATGMLQDLLPHRRFVGGIGSISGERVKPFRILQRDFPHQYIEELQQPDGTIDSPLMQRWRTKREPVLVELERDRFGIALGYIARIKKYGFKNAAVHGLVDVQGTIASFFCFVDIPQKLGPRHICLLKFLVPYLHVALVRSIADMSRLPDPHADLSKRQIEILGWIHKGKANWEIAEILGVSTDTIKYHVARILSKLAAANRAQAVAKALNLRIIE